MAIQNGRMPANILLMGTSSAMPLTTKTLTPTGGLMRPISSTMTMTTPNQMGSYPRVRMMGCTMGRVRTSMAKPSRNMPSTM